MLIECKKPLEVVLIPLDFKRVWDKRYKRQIEKNKFRLKYKEGIFEKRGV